jgi:hypothetical protein
MARPSILLAVALVSLACNPKSLRTGYCHGRIDCGSGETCNSASRKCEPMMDASTNDGDGGDTGPFKCMNNTDCAEMGAKNVCNMGNGKCEECLSDGHCMDETKPICNLTMLVCERCTTDSQCAAKVPNPGICMFHQDGRCATDAETIYVKNSTGCSMTAGGGGTSAVPYCFSQLGIDAVTGTNRLVVMRGSDALRFWAISTAGDQVSVIGQNGATIAPGADIGIHISSGNAYVRGLKVTGSSSTGVVADNGAELQMDGCVVESNSKGGILIDGAAFDIKNTTVTSNGPSADLTWGGIRIQNLLGLGTAQLELLTIQTNNPSGVSCAASVAGTGVRAVGNISGDISPTCGFSSCGVASTTCGAQP